VVVRPDRFDERSFFYAPLQTRQEPRHHEAETQFLIDERGELAAKQRVNKQRAVEDALRVDARILHAGHKVRIKRLCGVTFPRVAQPVSLVVLEEVAHRIQRAACPTPSRTKGSGAEPRFIVRLAMSGARAVIESMTLPKACAQRVALPTPPLRRRVILDNDQFYQRDAHYETSEGVPEGPLRQCYVGRKRV